MNVSVSAPASPYKGLAPFDDSELDALLFFGRERDGEVIAANLMAARITVLYSPSGFGKTSVLRAGVAYRLRREEEAEVVVFSTWPGDPVAALIEAIGGTGDSLVDAVADAANRAGGDLYLILDQFEEYFLYHQDGGPFVDALAEVARRPGVRVNLLIGIREETLAQLDAFKAAIPALLSNRLRLQRLDRASGEAAIVGPARRYNELVGDKGAVELEPQLVAAVLDEVAAGRVELGAMGRGVAIADVEQRGIEAPYLQLVMSRLWDVETGYGSKTLRLQTLRELGGAAQIVEDHLEHAMAALSPRQRDAAAAMYNFLVTPSGTKIAHRAADLSGYSGLDDTEARNVLRKLANERILRASAENGSGVRYEIFHDVLAEAVVSWRSRYEAQRALRQAEKRRRRALAVAAVALGALVLVGAIAIFAFVERSHSRADARRARARELAASASRALETDPQAALRPALLAARLEPGPPETAVLRAALRAANQRAVMRAGSPVRVARFDPTGQHIVTGAIDGKIRVYRVGSTHPETVLSQHGSVTAAEYSPNGRLLLTAGRDGSARLWSASGKPHWTVQPGAPLRDAFFVRRGDAVLTLADGGRIGLWRTSDGRLLRAIKATGAAVPKRVAVDPAGQLVATVGQDRFARVYSLATGRLTHAFSHRGFVHCVAFDPRGVFLLTCGHEGAARVWSLASGLLVKHLYGPGPKSPIVDGTFAPNGILVVAGVADGTARVWEAPTGFQRGIAFGPISPVTHVAFSPTGRSFVTGSLDNRARTWVVNGRPVSILAGHRGPLNSVEFSPDSRSILTSSEDGTARLWESGTQPQLALVARQQPITAFALSNDGMRVVVGDAHGTVRVRAVDRARVLQSLRASGPVTAVAFGPRGPIAATRPTLSLAVWRGTVARGMRNGSVLISDGHLRVKLRTGGGPVTALALSPDGQRLATGHASGVADLWELRTRRRLRRFSGHALAITSVVFAPDGRSLLTAGRDHVARTWNLRTSRSEALRRWHVGPLGSATFSPDGRWVLTAGPFAAGVGEISSSRPSLSLRGPATMAPLVGAAFGGRDRRLIVVASKDGTIRTYHCDICGNLHELMSLAARKLNQR